MQVRASHLVKAPREKVFQAYIDIESMPKWSDSAGRVTVLGSEADRIRFEVEVSTRKGLRRAVGELVLTPPSRVTTENETERSMTRGVVTFEDAPEGTLVTSTVEVKIKGLRRFLVRPSLGEVSREVAERNLASFAKYVEELDAREAS